MSLIRCIQALLADVREGRSLPGKPRRVYFVHVKSHQDDAKGAATDSNVLGNIRADTLVQCGKEDGPYSRVHGCATEDRTTAEEGADGRAKVTDCTARRLDGKLNGKS